MEDFVQFWVNHPMLQRLAAALVALLVIFIVVQLLQRSVSRYVADVDTRYRARKFIAYAGYFFALLLLISIFSARLGELSVVLGLVGAGVAFALQNVILSIAGWMAVSFGHVYQPGDRIQMGGIRGDVIDVSLLRTTLMECGEWVNGDLYTGRIVRLANSAIFQGPVYNYSSDFEFLWDELTVAVKYGSDYARMRKILERVAGEVAGEYGRSAEATWARLVRKYRVEHVPVAPRVSMIASTDWVEFTLRYVVEYRQRRATKDVLFTRILEEVDRHADRIHLATASFEVIKVPALDVRLQQ